MDSKKFKLSLAVVSGLLLGFSFPPVPIGVFALFAFIPFFILFESIESHKEAFRYSYVTFFIFNTVTLYWTGGFVHGKDVYMMIAGALLLFAHPFFFYVPIAAWMFFRRQFGFKPSVFIFPFLWIGFEYLHSLYEIGFPWLTIGNTQSYDLAIIQFTTFTGVYGLSFWILSFNVIAYLLYAKLALKEWKPSSMQSISTVLLIITVYLLPKFYGTFTLKETEGRKSMEGQIVRVGIVQPNIDPFDKWQTSGFQQIELHQQLTTELIKQNIDLVIWSETAFPFYILDQPYQMYFQKIKLRFDTLGIPLLTGIPDIIYYKEGDLAAKSSKIAPNGLHFDTYNSSMLLIPASNAIQKYAKVILVPFAERVPFSEELHYLNAMQWNFGLGGWGRGKDTTVFTFRTSKSTEVKFSNMICYESIYPGFVAAFVRKGAQFLTVITNDSWWGNTSGPYQHVQHGILRAVENRRWIAQCANGGISCFIDPYGRIFKPTDMYAQTVISAEIETKNELTFYTLRGDWFAEMLLMFSAFFLAAAFGKKFYLGIRTKEQNEIHRPAE